MAVLVWQFESHKPNFLSFDGRLARFETTFTVRNDRVLYSCWHHSDRTLLKFKEHRLILISVKVQRGLTELLGWTDISRLWEYGHLFTQYCHTFYGNTFASGPQGPIRNRKIAQNIARNRKTAIKSRPKPRSEMKTLTDKVLVGFGIFLSVI